MTSFLLLHDSMAMIAALIVTVSIVAPHAGATFSMKSSVLGRRAPFITAPLRGSTWQQHNPFVAAPLQGANTGKHLPLMRTTARAGPNLAFEATQPNLSPLDAVLAPNYGVSSNGIFGDWNKIIRADAPKIDYTAALADQDPKALSLAYKKCEDVTQEFSKTFYIGTALLRPEARKHGWAIYAWCRRVDDIVDSPEAMLNPTQLDSDLIEWNRRLNGIWEGKPSDMFDLAMADTVRYYPTLSIDPFREMIKGMVMDVPGHPNGKTRYQNFDELYLYCYRVAGTVGLMMLPILGTAKGVTQEDAKVPAVALGIALQLTNILRDVGEDLNRGRIYLPQDELKKFGITEEDLFTRKVTDKYEKFMKFQIARARQWYEEAAHGIPMLAPDARFAVQASLDLYGRILDKIEENGYDNLNKRAYTTGFEKLQILPGSWATSKSAVTPEPAAIQPVNLVSFSQDSDEYNLGGIGVVGAGVVSGVVGATLAALRQRRRSCRSSLFEPMLV